MKEELRDELMADLCHAARQQGWEKAVAERYGNLDQVPWIADSSRADPLLFAQIDRGSRVLDLGCRYGVLSFALAPLCRSIISLDHERPYAEFIKIRSQQDKTHNVLSLCGDINQIPFKQSSFDLIIINRQITSHITKENLDELLAAVYALLKPKGQIFMGIDRGSCKFPTYFFPYKKLRKRLDAIGFEIDKVIFPLKRYQNFKFLIDCVHKSQFHFMVNLMINDYTAKTVADKLYRSLAEIGRYAGLTKLLFKKVLLRSYLILASKP
jgi:SAM-dependent methyltransferase